MQTQKIKYNPEEYRAKLAEAMSTCEDGYLLATVYYFFINLRGGGNKCRNTTTSRRA